LHKAFKDRVSLSYSNLRDNLGMRAPQLILQRLLFIGLIFLFDQ